MEHFYVSVCFAIVHSSLLNTISLLLTDELDKKQKDFKFLFNTSLISCGKFWFPGNYSSLRTMLPSPTVDVFFNIFFCKAVMIEYFSKECVTFL